MEYIRACSINEIPNESYLSSIEGLKKFHKLTFDTPVTFFTGENGTGKSTILEAIAIAMGFNPEGGSKDHMFATRETHSILHENIKLVRGIHKPDDNFFLRCESLYNIASYIEDHVDNFHEYGNRSLHEQSHGESVLNLINNRFRGNGIYLLDEPETALSFQRQLALLSSIHSLVEENSQFIIVTHSPILLAYPNANIYSFDVDTPDIISLEESKPYEIMDMFINNRDSLFHHLFEK